MRFFCCCQADGRTSCSNCAAGFGGQASCPAGTTCSSTVPVPGGGTTTACIAPPDHECCGVYKWTAAGQIQPLACQYDLATAGNPCYGSSQTALVGVNRRKIVTANGVTTVGPCEDYITVDPIPWDVTYAAGAAPLAGGGCNLDAIFDPAPPAQPQVTVTIAGNLKTEVEVTFQWLCQSIQLTIVGRWYVRKCSGAGGCIWHLYCSGILSAQYLRRPDTGLCNLDGLYDRVGCGYVHPVVADFDPMYRTLDEVDPPTYPVACPDCLEDGGYGCFGPGPNTVLATVPGCGAGGRCFRIHEEYSCNLAPASITVTLI